MGRGESVGAMRRRLADERAKHQKKHGGVHKKKGTKQKHPQGVKSSGAASPKVVDPSTGVLNSVLAASAAHNNSETEESANVLTVADYRGPEDAPFLDILFVGEGNFSFSRALAEQLGSGARMVASSLDSAEVMRQKYDDADANVAALRALGATVIHGVDGTALGSVRALRERQFDVVAFHFPHSGSGVKSEAHAVRQNQQLLDGFFRSVRNVLRNGGRVHVTLRRGKPYDLWQMPALARAAGLRPEGRMRAFQPSRWPGYQHRRTLGFQEGISTTHNEDILRSSCYTLILH